MVCVLRQPSMDFSSISLPGCVCNTYNPYKHPTCTTASSRLFYCITTYCVKNNLSPFVYFKHLACSFHLMSRQPPLGLVSRCGHAGWLPQVQRSRACSALILMSLIGFAQSCECLEVLGRLTSCPFCTAPELHLEWISPETETVCNHFWVVCLTNSLTFGILHIGLPPLVIPKQVLDALYKWSLFKLCSEKRKNS